SIQDSTVEEAYVESIPHLQGTTPRFDNQAYENFPDTGVGLLYTSRENRCGNPMDNRVFGARIVHDSRRDRYVAFGGAYVGGDFRRDVECSPYYSVDSSDHVSRLVSLANTFRTWDPNKPRGNDAFGNLRIPIDYVGSFNGAGPAARVDHTMAYDAHRGVTVMYGGWTGASSDLTSMASETWEFGPNPATVGFLREPPERLELCLGETLALEVVPLQTWPNPRGTPPSLNEIRWFRDDSPIPSGTNAALVVENVDRSHAGEYRCEMIDPCGNVTVGRTTRVLVGGPPVIVQAPFSRHVCPGDASELRVLFQSDYPPTVQWFRVDLDLAGAASLAAQSSIPGADGNVLAFPSAKPSDNGYYRVRIANRCGTVWSTPVEFTAGVWLKRQANSSTNAVCTATELAVLASGKGRLRYAWRRNGEPLAASERVAGVDGPNLRFASLRYLDDAAYDCLVGDACHTVTTRVASVSVVPNPPFLLVDTNGPSARQRHAMVYDSLRGVTVLFGGIGATPEAGNFYRNDTWEYDGSRWTRRTPADAPSPRADFGMTYDRHRGRVVLFGGSKADPSSGRISDGETWEYDGTNWLRVLAEKSPAPRFNHTLFYDPVRRVTTLYGGDTSLANPRAGDIWVWDGVRWTERTLSGDRPAFGSTGSPPRPQMIWDERRGYAVLPPTTLNFGGSQDRATWTWDGTNWTRRVYVYEAFGRSPGQAGSGLGLVYDTFRGEVIYWSGDAFDQAYVWRWNGENWRRDDIPEWIGLHLYAGAAYDSRRHAVVLFGGNYTGSGVVPQGLSPRTFERVLADEPIFLRQSSLVDEPSRPARYLRVVAAGAPPLTFTWQRDGTNLLESFPFSGTRTDTLAVDRGLATDAARYRCVVRGPCGEATSLAIDLAGRVEPPPTTLALALDTRPTPGGPGIALTWTGTGVVLERAPQAAGPWVAIPEATSPYRPVLNDPSAFYRLRGP
ncbi:MAG: hypothetical protein JNL97_11470, partial [Verrucomicrobiales bacterium]|nr:hypothetical protein [Verrucomicrobiales bacterium]